MLPEQITPPAPSISRKIAKVFLYALGALAGLIIIVFLIFFVYYLWQFKFATPEELYQLDEQYRPKFTQIQTEEEENLTTITNYQQYIYPANPKMGEDNAPVKIIAFVDFQCPFCREDQALIKKILSRYQPVTQFIIKQLPFGSIHPEAPGAALASLCAEEQNKFWPFYDALFESPKLDRESLIALARGQGIDTESFTTCLENQTYKTEIDRDMLDAIKIGVRGTPTYLINNDVIEGATSEENWNQLIIKNLK